MIYNRGREYMKAYLEDIGKFCKGNAISVTPTTAQSWRELNRLSLTNEDPLFLEYYREGDNLEIFLMGELDYLEEVKNERIL